MRYLSILAVLMCSLQYLEADGSVSQRLATLSKQATKKAVTALATGTLAVSVVCSGLTGCNFSGNGAVPVQTHTQYDDSDNNYYFRQKETIFKRSHDYGYDEAVVLYSDDGWHGVYDYGIAQKEDSLIYFSVLVSSPEPSLELNIVHIDQIRGIAFFQHNGKEFPTRVMSTDVLGLVSDSNYTISDNPYYLGSLQYSFTNGMSIVKLNRYGDLDGNITELTSELYVIAHTDSLLD